MSDQVAEIKSRVDIAQIIGEKVALKQRGRRFLGLCPFHSEKTPSFTVSPEMGIFKCFGCGAAGDVFTFLEKHDGMTFVEALEFLAEKTGVKLERRAVDDRLQQIEKQIFEINHLAAEFYHYILTKHKAGGKAREYLKSRYITKSAIETFCIGYSPNQWDNLFKFLTKKGYLPEHIEQSGLAIKRIPNTEYRILNKNKQARSSAIQNSEFRIQNSYYDRFRGRVMFPLRDVRGQILGFAGRLLDPEIKEAKYINSPETAVYRKSKNLFGIFENHEDIRKKGEAVLVEGEFDCISSWQAGIKNVVAVKGTALTSGQVKLVRRYGRKVVVCLDSDSAGQEALIRSLPILEHHSLSSRAVVLPESEKDPDELAKSSPSKWRESVEKSKNAYGVIIESTLEKFGKDTAEAKRQAGDVLVPLLSEISNAIEQDHWVSILAKRLGVRDEAVRRQMSAWKQNHVSPSLVAPAGNESAMSRAEILSHYLLGLLIQFKLPLPENFDLNWVKPVGRRKLMELLKEFIKLQNGDFKIFRQSLPPELIGLFDEAAIQPLKGEDSEEAKSELGLILRDLEAELVRNQLKDGKLPPQALSHLAARLKQLVRKD
ncbi:toprim domain-containing protein [Candidatus Collierbacteria bacterium]|nr:toprim domain-containing protein [Candidatus Collierbacteria bacterium]